MESVDKMTELQHKLNIELTIYKKLLRKIQKAERKRKK